MIAAALAGMALGTAAMAWVLAPLLDSRTTADAETERQSTTELRDLDSEREMTLAALKDLEDDRATGKMGDADYQELRARLTSRGAEILRRIDEIRAKERSTSGPPPAPRPRSVRR